MKTAVCKLASLSPYSQSRKLRTERGEKEGADEHEKRCWKERMLLDEDGRVIISPMAIKFSIETAARFLSISIPGEGKSKYTKHFKSGILVPCGVVVAESANDVEGEWLFLHSNGTRGSGKRVWRCYPKFPKWAGTLEVMILDDTIPKNIFERVFSEAGNFIGIGRFRPENGGFYGRYEVTSVKWK